MDSFIAGAFVVILLAIIIILGIWVGPQGAG